MNLSFRLRDVGDSGIDRSVGRIVVGFGDIQLLLAEDATLVEAHGAVVVGFGLNESGVELFQIGASRDEIGLRVGEVGFGFKQSTFKEGGIDDGDDVALVYARVEVSAEFGDGSGNLRAHEHSDNRIDGSGRLNHIIDGTAFDLSGEILDLSAISESEIAEDPCDKHNRGYADPLKL